MFFDQPYFKFRPVPGGWMYKTDTPHSASLIGGLKNMFPARADCGDAKRSGRWRKRSRSWRARNFR